MRNTLSYRTEYNEDENENVIVDGVEKKQKGNPLMLIPFLLIVLLIVAGNLWFWYWVFKNVFALIKGK
tara:strand:+ start:504 stop:707 length:204 start_codon:yes stop_codon:yes gene_type:complete